MSHKFEKIEAHFGVLTSAMLAIAPCNRFPTRAYGLKPRLTRLLDRAVFTVALHHSSKKYLIMIQQMFNENAPEIHLKRNQTTLHSLERQQLTLAS